MRWSVARAGVCSPPPSARPPRPSAWRRRARPWRTCTTGALADGGSSPAEAQRVANLPCASIAQTELLVECRFGRQERPSPRSRSSATATRATGAPRWTWWPSAAGGAARRSRARTARSPARARPFRSRARAVRRVEPPGAGVAAPPPRGVHGLRVGHRRRGRGRHRRGQVAAQAAGYLAAWRALPRTVERVVVIRDTPKMRSGTPRCVTRAMRAHRDAGTACAVSRRRALIADAAVSAARRWRSRRVRIVDLTPWMCAPSRCFPVIGGVLVFRDTTHLTRAFSATLAPYLERRFRRAG